MIKELPKSERPMEKAISEGVEALSTAELVALIIGSGFEGRSAISVGEDVIGLCSNGLFQLSSLSIEDLLNIGGIGYTKACRIKAALELGKRVSSSIGDELTLSNSADIGRLFMEKLRGKTKEHFYVLSLNGKNKLIGTDLVSIGSLASAPVHPREVFGHAIDRRAASVAFVHNHPSGVCEPSEEDYNITARLMECGDLLGIKVVDHVIIGNGKFRSILGILNRSKSLNRT